LGAVLGADVRDPLDRDSAGDGELLPAADARAAGSHPRVAAVHDDVEEPAAAGDRADGGVGLRATRAQAPVAGAAAGPPARLTGRPGARAGCGDRPRGDR